MSDGDGNLPQDEEVEYLEQLLREQIRTAHDTAFQRLEQSLQAAIDGLEKARRDLNDLVQRDFDKALKKLVRTVPDEVGRVVTQVVKERLPAFSGVDERIESVVAQISALKLALENTDAALQVHIGDWKRETTHAKKVAEETRTLIIVVFVFVALIVFGAPVCAAVWWWFQQ